MNQDNESHLDLTIDLHRVRNMKEVPYHLQMKVVQADFRNIKYIREPCEQAQFEAYRQNVHACAMFTNATERFQQHVIRDGNARYAIRHMYRLSKDSLKLAFELDPHSILFFMRGTVLPDWMQLEAIKNAWELRLYDSVLKQFERSDEETFHNEIKKLKLEYGPMIEDT